jgi:hypothetical protein
MENSLGFFILIVLYVFLQCRYIGIQDEYKKKSKIIQQKIDDFRLKNTVLKRKETDTKSHLKKVNQIEKQFMYLHNLIIKKHLK